MHFRISKTLRGYLGAAFLLPAFVATSWSQTRLPPPDQELPPATAVESTYFDEPSPLPAPTAKPSPFGGGMGPGMGMGMGGPGGGQPFSMNGTWTPSAAVHDQPGTLAAQSLGLSLAAPVHMGPDGIWLASARADQLQLATDAVFPQRALAFPQELWNINFGLIHIHPLDNGWTAGGMVGVGSASDQPFGSVREMNVNVLAFLNIPWRERDAWNFSVMYSPLGQIAFPIPGVSYLWRPNDQFQANIGVPFNLTYRPTEALTFTVMYMPLTNVNATARWQLDEVWSVYGAFQTHSQGYQLADRADAQERFFVFDQRLSVGVRRKFGSFALDCSAGYLFDRSFFLSDSFFGRRSDEVGVDNGVNLVLRFEWSPPRPTP